MVDVVTPSAVPMTETPDPRAVVSWAGPGEPIMLKVYSDGGQVAVPLTPTRALELGKDLIEPAVQSIKTERWGPGWPG